MHALQTNKKKYRLAKGDKQSKYYLNETSEVRYGKQWKDKSMEKSYEEKLREVVRKKEEINSRFFERTIRRL